MTILRQFVLLCAVTLFATSANAALPAPNDAASSIYAQRLADQIAHNHVGIMDVIFHVTPPGKTKNIAIASHITGERGKPSGDDELGVIRTGKPLVEIQKDGVRIGVLVPLMDDHGNTIGALGIVYAYHRGQAEQPFLMRSMGIRNSIAKRISSEADLFVRSTPGA